MFNNLIKIAIEEDLGRGDLFSLIGKDEITTATIITKQDGIFAGEICIKEICKLENLELSLNFHDGDEIKYGDKICEIKGSSNSLLALERVILDFVQHASGIATKTREFVNLLKDYKTVLLDTRKTRPGLRILEKYAIRCGGGVNHRLGLDDCLMLKDTNLKTIKEGELANFIKLARKKIPFTSKIEIESESFEESIEFMKIGIDIIMCDNMKPSEVKRIVDYRNEHHPLILLEASGNINLQTVEEYAKTGVDSISTGATIHQATWLDFSMKIL